MGLIFGQFIKNRTHKQLNFYQSTEQAGFRKVRSTLDQLFIINQLIEKANEYKLTLNIMYIKLQDLKSVIG